MLPRLFATKTRMKPWLHLSVLIVLALCIGAGVALAFISYPEEQQTAAEKPLGVDENDNELWDDIDIVVNETYVGKPMLQDLIFNLALAYQRTLTAAETVDEARFRWLEMEQAKACVDDYFSDMRPNDDMSSKTRFLQERLERNIYSKNDRRFDAFIKYSDLIAGINIEEQSCLQTQ